MGHRAFKSAPSTDPTPSFTHSPSTFPCWGVGTPPKEEVQYCPPICQGQQVPCPWGLEQDKGVSALLLSKDSASSSRLQ